MGGDTWDGASTGVTLFPDNILTSLGVSAH